MESNPRSLCDWSRKLPPFSQPIICKTKTNLVFIAGIGSWGFFLSSGRLSGYLWFWFYDTLSKSALNLMLCYRLLRPFLSCYHLWICLTDGYLVSVTLSQFFFLLVNELWVSQSHLHVIIRVIKIKTDSWDTCLVADPLVCHDETDTLAPWNSAMHICNKAHFLSWYHGLLHQ